MALVSYGPQNEKTRPIYSMGDEIFRGPYEVIERRFYFFDTQSLGFECRTSKSFSSPIVEDVENCLLYTSDAADE